jgi:phage tail sheath gpL-like
MLNPDSQAAVVGAGANNTQFQPAAENVPRQILIIATYDPAKTTIVDEVPVQVLSPEDAGDRFGFGFMAHRLALRAFETSQGIPAFIQPQSEAGGAVEATGEVDFAGSTGVEAGTLYFWIAGYPLASVAVTAGMTVENLADALVAAINADKDQPVTAVKTAVTFEVVITAKTKGPWGNDISLNFNLGLNQALPTGVVAAITPMASGAGIPVIQDALDGLGTGDDANEDFFTDMVHGYGQDTTTLDSISTYVGAGNDFVGLWSKTVHRPFRAVTGDVVAGSGGLTALQAVADARKLDRANGVIAVPGSPNHPSEIAALALGVMARVNQIRAAESYVDQLLPGVIPGAKSDRWTSDYDNRDIAVKNGISPTHIKSGNVVMQNMMTFYRPDSVPVTSNGYRSMRNICILQNILDNEAANYEQAKWQGIFIVSDITNVSSTVDATKARDVNSVIDDEVALVRLFESKGWIFDAAFSINKLKEPGAVTIRANSTGFDKKTSVILSVEGGIIDSEVLFDISTAVLTS